MKQQQEEDRKVLAEKDDLRMKVFNLKHVPLYVKEEILRIVEGEENIRTDILVQMKSYEKQIKANWPKGVKEPVLKLLKGIKVKEE